MLPRVLFPTQQPRLRGWARGGPGGGLITCAWGHLRGGIHVGAEGLRSKTKASRSWCVVRGAHKGALLLHVATGTGHPGEAFIPWACAGKAHHLDNFACSYPLCVKICHVAVMQLFFDLHPSSVQ
jgi:hypothetical protein